jgi:oligosaccharide repeat unit polymerase
MWMIVFTVIVLFNDFAFDYMTLSGVIIIFAHIFILILGSLFFSFNKTHVKKKVVYLFHIPISRLYFILFFLSIVGIYFLLNTINLKEAVLNNELAELRGEMLSKEIAIPIQATIFMNFLYPFAIVTPLYCFLVDKRFYFILISFTIFALFSLSSGGKGGIVILTILMFGASLFLIKHKAIVIDKKLKFIVVFISLLIFGFMTYINSTRTSNYEKTNVFVAYFSSSVPSFCKLLEIKDWQLLDFNFDDHVITRVSSGLMGQPRLWAMDKNVVYVPEAFNVFSCFADSIFSLGLLGSLIYYFNIGVVMAYADRKYADINNVFLFAIMFLFSFYSFFVDVFYFMAGSWYCILFYLVMKIKFLKKSSI